MYNCKNTIVRCLNSILSQSFKNFVLCCIDDGSSDDSFEIAKGFANRFGENLILISNNSICHGPSSARNVALKSILSICKYITFVDSDDYLDSDYLKRMHELLIENNCDIICASFYFSHLNKEKPFMRLPREGVYDSKVFTSYLLEGYCVLSQSWAKMYKSSLWVDVRYPEDIFVLEDYATLYKVFLKSKRIYCSSYCGYHYWLESDSILRSSLSNEKIFANLNACLRVYNDIKNDKLLESSCMQFLIKNYLMFFPRIKKDNLNEIQKNIFIEYKKLMSKKNIRRYCPIEKNEWKKKRVFLFSKSLYRIAYGYALKKKEAGKRL